MHGPAPIRASLIGDRRQGAGQRRLVNVLRRRGDAAESRIAADARLVVRAAGP